VVYFYSIRDGLQSGMDLYSQPGLDITGFMAIGNFLFMPWGVWLVFMLGLGLFRFKNNEKFLKWFVLLGVPIALTFISGVVGFPRNYIYLLPFLLMGSGVGVMGLFTIVKNIKPISGVAFASLIFLLSISQSVQNTFQHISKRLQVSNGTMAEAIQVRDYIKSETSFSTLFVVVTYSPGMSVLHHYAAQEIKDRMFLFLAGKKN